MPLLAGCSGWQYRHWRGSFYPSDLPSSRWLEHYAARFPTVEVNNTFYRLPEAKAFEQWAATTPEGFLITLKMSRFVTHQKRLRDPEEPVARFLERARHLGPKLGPVLLQLPPNLKADQEALARVLDLMTPVVRTAVEPRHESWFDDATRATLADHGAALCLVDRLNRMSPVWRTADWAYVRFHEGIASPRPCYGRQHLATWARRLAREWGPRVDIYAYFNNDGEACAPRDATTLASLAEREGLTTA